jgi:hypothetical protein
MTVVKVTLLKIFTENAGVKARIRALKNNLNSLKLTIDKMFLKV